eukprot:Amastigsp_a1149_25.p3 type:complete len:120 gc:universal Amastigsp_a1149_25:495-136(-)
MFWRSIKFCPRRASSKLRSTGAYSPRPSSPQATHIFAPRAQSGSGTARTSASCLRLSVATPAAPRTSSRSSQAQAMYGDVSRTETRLRCSFATARAAPSSVTASSTAAAPAPSTLTGAS